MSDALRNLDWRDIKWAPPFPDCPTCKGNPYWGKTLSAWDRCRCVRLATIFQREPGTCKCGAAPINKDGMCATCADEAASTAPRWTAFRAAAWPKLWGIETTDPRAVEAGLEILVAPCMPEHAAKTLAEAYNSDKGA